MGFGTLRLKITKPLSPMCTERHEGHEHGENVTIGNAITHSWNHTKTEVRLKWKQPEVTLTAITTSTVSPMIPPAEEWNVIATIVQNKETFWINVKGPKIDVIHT